MTSESVANAKEDQLDAGQLQQAALSVLDSGDLSKLDQMIAGLAKKSETKQDNQEKVDVKLTEPPSSVMISSTLSPKRRWLPFVNLALGTKRDVDSFGGTHVVVSFSPDYSSAKIFVRFAVVQRKRMMDWHK